MSVVPFRRVYETEALMPERQWEASADRKRLRLYGHVLSAVFLFIFALNAFMAAGMILTIFFHFHHMFICGYYRGNAAVYCWSPLDAFDPMDLAGEFKPKDFPLATAIKLVPQFIVMSYLSLSFYWSLVNLFRLYARGSIFGSKNTQILRRMGGFLLASGCAPLILVPTEFVLGVFKTRFVITSNMFTDIFVGLAIMAIAHVMDIGRRIQQDQDEIL